MEFTYFGHATFSVNVGGKVFLFDPFITGNPLVTDIDIHSIKADYILVSHGHGDHVGDLLEIARNTGALVLTNAEIADWVVKQGYKNVHPLNFGSMDFEFGKLHYVPAAHSSGLPDGTYGGNPGGFILKVDGHAFYYSGDTSITAEMQMIPHYGKLDFAVLPIGGNFTMDPEDAVFASTLIQCNRIIGVHFDTFGYIKIDHEAAIDRFEAAGKSLILPQIGETLSL